MVAVIGCWYWPAVRSQTLASEVCKVECQPYRGRGVSDGRTAREVLSANMLLRCTGRSHIAIPALAFAFRPLWNATMRFKISLLYETRLISKSELTSYMCVMAMVRAVESVICSPLIVSAGGAKCVFCSRDGRWQAICWRVGSV